MRSMYEWLHRNPLGRKLRWTMAWLVYPVPIAIDLARDPDTGSLPLDIIAVVFGTFLFAAAAGLMVLGPAIEQQWPWVWWSAPAATGFLYLFFGLVHYVMIDEIYRVRAF